MLLLGDAERVAGRFGLGTDAVLSGPVARGELGQVWRIETPEGRWAVKEPFDAPSPDEATDDARFQDDVRSAGVPMPAIVRTIDGDVVADVGSSVVRVYEWADLQPLNRRLDPAAVGRLVATIHRVRHVGSSPLHWWYTDAVGAMRWDALITKLAAADAPFAPDVAALRDELVAVEALLEAPSHVQTCHRDLFADNILATAQGGLCVIDWENSGLADPTQELAGVLVEFACGDAIRARQLYEAYVDADGPGRLEGPGDFSMALCSRRRQKRPTWQRLKSSLPSSSKRPAAETKPAVQDAEGRGYPCRYRLLRRTSAIGAAGPLCLGSRTVPRR